MTVSKNERFGRLTVLSLEGKQKNYVPIWRCLCDCGKLTFVNSNNLTRGTTKSCGCLRKDKSTKHGECWKDNKRSKEYRTWNNIQQRCCNKQSKAYKNYGGRGVTMHESWRRSFEQFLADVGRAPSEAHSIDRYPNNDGNYEPGNVRWATPYMQNLNKRTNRHIKFKDQTKTMTEWAALFGIHRSTLAYRLDQDWPVEKALTSARYGS